MLEDQSLIDNYVIYTKTDLKGHITYASKAFCDISGYTKDELMGKQHNIIRHPDMPSSAFKELWETIQDGKIWTGTVKNRKKDGKYYITKSVVSPVFDENNKIIEYSSVREDITPQVKAEEFQKKLGLLVKETKLKQMAIANEYKQQLVAKDKIIDDMKKQNYMYELDIANLRSAKSFLETKATAKKDRGSLKKEHFQAVGVDNSQDEE